MELLPRCAALVNATSCFEGTLAVNMQEGVDVFIQSVDPVQACCRQFNGCLLYTSPSPRDS